jgi:uncharacterized ion transporter superfamily protein YfcC
MSKAKFKSPNTYFILSSILVLMALLTWIIPASEYETMMVGEREVVDPETFHYVDRQPQSIGPLFMAPIRGFVDAAEIIGFVLIVGGIFGIFQRTKP